MSERPRDYGSALERLLPDPRSNPRALEQMLRGIDDEFWFWLNTEGYRQSERVRAVLPNLPDEELQVGTIGSSGDAALREAFAFYLLVSGSFRKHAGALGPGTRVLDFGCGWGRMLRFFLRDTDPTNLWGVDPSRRLIEVCRQTNQRCQFVQSRLNPPSPFDDEYFDLVYSYSVFSHLSEGAHRMWLDEIRRILRPGGVLVATTWQREHIQRSEELRKADRASLSAWHRDLAGLWMDTQYWLAEYDAGRFCYQPYPLDTHPWSYQNGDSHYGEACIPEPWVSRNWTGSFDILEFIDDRRRCAQNVIVVRRR